MRNFLKKFLVSIAIMCTVFCLSAREITLNETVNLALENSTDLKSAYNTYKKAVNNGKVNSLLPSLSLNGKVSASAADITEKGALQSIDPSFTAGAGLSWNISSSGVISKIQSNLTLQNAELVYEAALISAKSNAVSAYCNLISAKNQLSISENSYETAKKNYDRTQAKYDASQTTSLALAQSKVTLGNALVNLKKAEDAYNSGLKNFRNLTGLSEDESVEQKAIEIPENITEEKLREIVSENLSNTTTWKRAEIAKKASEISALNSELSAVAPTVSADLSLSSALKNYEGIKASGSVSVSVPVDTIIPWSKNNANVKNAFIDKENAQIIFDTTIDKLTDSVNSSISSIIQLLETRKNIVPLAELARESYDLVFKAYEEGSVSASELASSYTSFTEALVAVESNTLSIMDKLCSFASLVEVDYELLLEALS